jgi:hypothetical protein
MIKMKLASGGDLSQGRRSQSRWTKRNEKAEERGTTRRKGRKRRQRKATRKWRKKQQSQNGLDCWAAVNSKFRPR